MTTLKRAIVVGVDGSPGGVAAIDWAAAEADRRGVGLELLHADGGTPPFVGADATMVMMPAEPVAPHFLQEGRLRVVTAYPDLDVSTVTVSAGPSYALVSRSEGAELIVVGARGRSLISRMLLGSVSQHVVTHAHCPTVVVRGGPVQSAWPVSVGIDDSPTSMAALGWAFQEAALRSAPLTVFHAWQEPPVTGYGVWAPPPGIDAELRAEAERLLAQSLVGWAEQYPGVEVHLHVVRAHPTTAVLDESRRSQLIVLGSHGRGAFLGMAFGSVPSAAVREAECPVLVVPPPHEDGERRR